MGLTLDQRDELIIRIDERQIRLITLAEKQEEHLRTLNDKVAKNVLDIADNRSRTNGILEYGAPLHLTKGQTTLGGTGLLTLICSIIAALGRYLSWW